MWVLCNGNLHKFVVGMKNGTATLDSNVLVSYIAELILTVFPRNFTPIYLP